MLAHHRPEPSPPSSRTFLPFLVPLLLLVLAYLLFANTFACQWVMDDFPVLVENPDILTLKGFLNNSYPGRPLREITYLLDHAFFGLEPAGYHVQNIFWHALSAWLLFRLTVRLGGGQVAAWAASLLFLTHPLTVEVVANVSHRKDSLMLAFALCALLAYVRALEGPVRRPLWLITSLVAAALASLAKENAVAIPLLFMAYEAAFLPEDRRLLLRSRRLLRLGGLCVAAAVAVWYGFYWRSAGIEQKIGLVLAKVGEFEAWSRTTYLWAVFKGWAFMALKIFWPADLAMEYSFAVPRSWADPWVLASLAGAVVVALALRAAWGRRPGVFFAIAWVAAFWLPTSNIFYPVAYFAADRYLYAPLAGVCMLVAMLVSEARAPRVTVRCAALALIIATLATLTWEQNKVWRTADSLHRQILRVSPGSIEGLIGMGRVHMDRGELDEALAYFQRAESRSINSRVYANMGIIFHRKGDLRRSLQYLKQAVDVDPGNAEVFSNLGSVYDDLGDHRRAVEAINRAISLDPHLATAYQALGVSYERVRRYREAEQMYRRALAEGGEAGEAYHGLGVALYRQGRLAEALNAFGRAAQLMPENSGSLFSWAVVALEVGDAGPAVDSLPRLRRLNPKQAAELERELDAFRNREE